MPIGIINALAFITKHWKLILTIGGYVALGVALYFAKADATHWHNEADKCAQSRKLDQANYRAAQAQAVAKATQDARDTEQRHRAATEETQHALETQLDDARRIASDYARRMRANTAAQGHSGQADMSDATNATGLADGASEATVVSVADLQICTENTVKAQGWQDWWTKIQASSP